MTSRRKAGGASSAFQSGSVFTTAAITSVTVSPAKGRGQRPERQPIGQRRPLDQLHDERTRVAVGFDPVDVRDMRMVERGERPGLAFESRQPGGVRRKDIVQCLDRNVAIEPGIAGAIDLAHAPFAQLGDDVIWTDGPSDHRVSLISGCGMVADRAPPAAKPAAPAGR